MRKVTAPGLFCRYTKHILCKLSILNRIYGHKNNHRLLPVVVQLFSDWEGHTLLYSFPGFFILDNHIHPDALHIRNALDSQLIQII